jgi:hypothetical protein
MPRAAQIVSEVDRTVYDAIFVALAEVEGTAVVTAERRPLNAPKGTPFADLLWSLSKKLKSACGCALALYRPAPEEGATAA